MKKYRSRFSSATDTCSYSQFLPYSLDAFNDSQLLPYWLSFATHPSRFSLLAYSHNPFIILLAIIKHTLLSAPYSKDHTTLCLEHCYGINYFSASSIRNNSLLRAQHSKLLPLATIFLSIFRAVKISLQHKVYLSRKLLNNPKWHPHPPTPMTLPQL